MRRECAKSTGEHLRRHQIEAVCNNGMRFKASVVFELMNKKLENWQQKSAWPLIALSFVYVFAYVYPIFAYPCPSTISISCSIAEYGIWGVFLFDYLIQFLLAADRRAFLRSEWFAILIVLFPFFRPVRAIRGVILLRQAGTHPKHAMVLSIPWICGLTSVLMTVIMAATELNIERFAIGSNIHTASDALWWALVTMTTIGYGDKFPVTNEGRLAAAVLFIFGLGMVASLTGYFTSWLINQTKSINHIAKTEY